MNCRTPTCVGHRADPGAVARTPICWNRCCGLVEIAPSPEHHRWLHLVEAERATAVATVRAFAEELLAV